MNKLLNPFEKIKKKRFDVVVIVSIVAICAFFYVFSFHTTYTNTQQRKDASGFSHDKAKEFAYFHYYLNLFPLATLDTIDTYSTQGAKNLIQERGQQLIMEYQHWTRLGENARIFAYLPNSILKGSPESPSIRLFNALIFTLCLITCYLGFARIQHRTLGLWLVLIVLLTPYFRYEIFQNENIFGLLIPLFLACLALNVTFFKRTSVLNLIILPIVTGTIIGFFSELRGEIMILVASISILYILSKNLLVIGKLFAILLLVGSVFTIKKSVVTYFDYKFEEAYQIVKQKGGHTYDGKRIMGHKFWHPVFCGLGDFDRQFGYQWNDRVAYQYAFPLLKENYMQDIRYSGKLHLDNYYDEDQLYYIKFDEIDQYEEIVKDKVLSDISNNPWWYTKIIAKRVNRILTETLPFHWIGWIGIPFLFFLFRKKKWFDLKLFIVGLPLSFTPLFIYSGGHSTYNSVFGIILLALIVRQLSTRFIFPTKFCDQD